MLSSAAKISFNHFRQRVFLQGSTCPCSPASSFDLGLQFLFICFFVFHLYSMFALHSFFFQSFFISFIFCHLQFLIFNNSPNLTRFFTSFRFSISNGLSLFFFYLLNLNLNDSVFCSSLSSNCFPDLPQIVERIRLKSNDRRFEI